ncbi:hypothetical protein AMEX_G6127 [Astyanax mexicanus]|uniref:Uncharacterized protein n=1 Tax=Astyanax mexicanus TaxID=7994 RepID=A0A8T2M1U5_ASTMX|nr:hypothetical protein AMEX_G6127 [Astyanax mexicanus]
MQDRDVAWAEAKQKVVAGGGDPRDNQLVASVSTIQFGQYRGKNFRWLLENDMGYAAMVLAGHQKERESGDLSETALMSNKDVLLKYASFYPEVAEAIKQRRQGGTVGDCLVGFGAHKTCTCKDLYESQDKEKKSYVQWLRVQKTRPGTKMDALKKYIQKRDLEVLHSTSFPPPPMARDSPLHRSSHKAPEPTDDELMMCAEEVERSGVCFWI